MPTRIDPTSDLGRVALVLILSAALLGGLVRERPRASEAGFFFLGAGFMLVETKAITELGLAFGNTWQVVGVAIGSILVFAFLANGLVERLGVRDPRGPLLGVLASLAAGLAVSWGGGLPPTAVGRLGTAALLTCPVFFSGLAFSSLLAGASSLPRAMAANLFGALCGGLLEYNAMYFGYRSLYGVAMALYGLALLGSWRGPRKAVDGAMAPAAAAEADRSESLAGS
jgi:hypothetical protein